MRKSTNILLAALLVSSAVSAQNKINIVSNEGSTTSYNTSEVSSVAINGNTVTVAPQNTSFTASRISFTKIAAGAVQIQESAGWLESAYITWAPLEGASSYNVYVKGGSYTEYTKLDDQLVRNYGTYGRADALGLKAGVYSLKVVPVINNAEDETKASEATSLTVSNYNREGFAHFNRTVGVGAYNNDGSLKAGAIVLYVTKNNAKTVTATLANGTFTGLQAIINAYQKKNVTQPPLDIRVIGLLKAEDMDAFGSSSEGIQIKGAAKDSPLNITIEGVGNDATIHGFGFLIRNAASIEMRNLGIMRQMDDGISLDTDNKNIWIHNVDVFYGKQGGGDHAKGDGGIDVKADSKFVTIDNCHFWDTGKSSMCGMKSETGPNYITYHHNWFDHSDSRHPRVRTMSVHLYNNYYDGVAKYGAGAAASSDVFVEKNYFRDTKYPMTIASQAHDIKDDGSSVLSGEDGGIIKAFDNVIKDLPAKGGFTPYSQNNTDFDAYVATTRDEKVPATVTAKKGGHAYNNFDTDPSLMYSYTPDNANDVPEKVTGFLGAGRINHGDFKFTFNNAVDDESAEINTKLSSAIDNYKSTLVGIFGDPDAQSGETGEQTDTTSTGGQTGGEIGGDTGGTTISSSIECTFNGSVSNPAFTFVGSYGDSETTINGVNLTKGAKINSKGSITFTTDKEMTITVIVGSNKANNVSIDGTKHDCDTATHTYTGTLPAGTHKLAKDKASEYIVMYIGLK